VPASAVAAGTIATGGTVAIHTQINPYEVSADRYELRSESTIEAAGENAVLAHRDRPAVTLTKWGGEAAMAMTVAYHAFNAQGSRQFLTARIEWRGDSDELHAYPLPASNGMEDGGLRLKSISQRPPTPTSSSSRSKAPRTSTFSISQTLHLRNLRKAPFGLRTSSTHAPSITRRKPTTG
jgi:hypothetical protein